MSAIVLGTAVLVTGCGGDARVQLAAADALDAVAVQIDFALREYDADLVRLDDAREEAVIEAFVARVARGATGADEFQEALRRLRADRAVQQRRHMACIENVDVLRETASGLRRLAVESLAISDEADRYAGMWLQRMMTRPAEEAAPPEP